MRISADKKDPGFNWHINLAKVRVYFNDQLFTRAITADEEENLVIAYKDATRSAIETLYGKVRIEVLGYRNCNIREPRVKVERFNKDLQVLVYSQLRPQNIRRHVIPEAVLKTQSPDALGKMCEALAGAAAEHLCTAAGDIFDPVEVAKAGREAYLKMVADELQAIQH